MTTFPNVPNVPGVPPVPRGPGATGAAITLLVNDLISLLGLSLDPQWGIFLDGEPVVIAETVGEFGYRQDWVVANYPLERGAFESYDKVSMPFESHVQFASGGSAEARAALLASIANIAGDTELYDVATPERVYTSVNVVSYDYRRRSDRGLGMIIVDVKVMEVRVTATSNFTKSAAAANAQVKGQVQPTAATQTQIQQLTGGIGRA